MKLYYNAQGKFVYNPEWPELAKYSIKVHNSKLGSAIHDHYDLSEFNSDNTTAIQNAIEINQEDQEKIRLLFWSSNINAETTCLRVGFHAIPDLNLELKDGYYRIVDKEKEECKQGCTGPWDCQCLDKIAPYYHIEEKLYTEEERDQFILDAYNQGYRDGEHENTKK